MNRWFRVLLAAWLAGPVAGLGGAEVGLIQIKGVIGPATAGYISRGIDFAGSRGYACLILQLDTPGGSLESTREIVQKLYASTVPTVVYVAPAGAWAGSAGCFITMAADVAAMAPSTSIGAAHPVSIFPGAGESTNSVMKEKLENIAGSYIVGIAKKRGRNAEWAKASVINSQALSATEALETNVIDLIAEDIPDLLKKLHGKAIDGKPLKTAGANVVTIPMTARERVLQVLSHPELMLLLMLVAMYGIIGELSNPGAVLPGVVGAIALVLVLYMAAILPVNTAGLVFIGLAVVLFIVDIYAPTHGVLTFGGIASFFLGTLMLFDRAEPGYGLSLAYIIPATVVTALFFVFVAGAGVRAQLLPVRAGRETMLGKTGNAVARIDQAGGKIMFEGEYWNALSDLPVAAGQPVEIIGIEGLTLKVKPQPSTTDKYG